MPIPKARSLRPARFALAVLFAALLAACGGGSGEVSSSAPAPAPVDPLASFTQQKLDWKPCDPTLIDAGPNPITTFGDRVKCTLMRAPLDYANPALGELKVALLKVSAEQPDKRRGAILVNPGGPGGDGLLLGFRFTELFALGNPADPTGMLLKDISNRYDMIGFSPRGVGAGTTVTCISPELLETSNSLTFDRSAQNIKNAQRNARLQAEACDKNPLTKYISTDATARDMDLVRGVLGDDKLNFIGFSYGTWLGAWYASLFPERVGRMLLDSSMNVTGSFDDALLLSEVGRQRVMDEIVLPYAARHPQRFNLGTDPSQIKNAILALPLRIKSALMSVVLNLNNTQDFDRNPLGIAAAVGVQALRQQLPQADLNTLNAAIDTYPFTLGPDNAVAAELARPFAPLFFNQPQRSRVFLDPDAATRFSVICNDLATVGDEQRWVDIGNDYAARYPLAGGTTSANNCISWSAPVTNRPALAAASKAGPLLMLQSRYDAPTPIEGAQKTLAALPNASMIVVENEFTHALFPYGTRCVDGQVADYFVNGTMPPRTSSCDGKPLPADAPASAARERKATLPSSLYTDPAKAEETMRQIRKITEGASRSGF